MVKEISKLNKHKIRQAKITRERKGGPNHHEEQCLSVPGIIDPNMHGVHITPCYKKFTLILSTVPKKSSRLQKILCEIVNRFTGNIAVS